MNKSKEILLEVKNIKKDFPVETRMFFTKNKSVHAVDDVSFNIQKGDIFALVGESGCGKTTIGRMILKLEELTSGEILFKSKNIDALNKRRIKQLRKKMQIIFQDPYSSLNPRKTIGSCIETPLIIQGFKNRKIRKKMVIEIMNSVGLDTQYISRYPHELSGGQKQRVVIARALVLKPELIICDEPVASLDVSIQSQILNLLKKLQKEFNLSYLFISHDLSVVKYISKKIAVMYLGKFVEYAETANFFYKPIHPYSRALLSAVPIADPFEAKKRNRIIIKGEIPSPIDPPNGCYFNTRCVHSKDLCKAVEPKLKNLKRELGYDHWCACHYSKKFI